MTPVRQGGSPYLFSLQFFCLCLLFSVALSKTVRYSTFEEDAPGTVIGTLAEDMHMKATGEMSFRLMKQFNSSLIRVREADGQLTVGESGIDREQLCRQSLQCILAFDVVSFSQEQFRLVHVEVEPYSSSPGYGKEPAPPVAIWKGHSFNTISGREAEKFSGKDSGKGDSDFNDSDSDISGDALKKDLINHMQSGLWACTAECKILGHSDRCWSPSCGRTNAHSSPHPSAQLSTFCKSTSLPRDPLRRDNYYQAQLPKTVGLQSVYEKVLHRDYDRTITLLSPPRPGRLPDLQEIGVPLYQPPPARYLPPQSGTNDNV